MSDDPNPDRCDWCGRWSDDVGPYGVCVDCETARGVEELRSTPVYRCTYCGQFYSMRTKHMHQVCHKIEERANAVQ